MLDSQDDIQKMLGEFLTPKRPATKRCYLLALRDLAKCTTVDLCKVTFEDCANYYRSMQERDLADNTKALRITLLSHLFEFFRALGVIQSNPWKAFQMTVPSQQRALVRPTPDVDLEKIKAAIALPDTSTKEGVRDYAILCVLFGAGLRRSEISGLRIDDVQLEGEEFLIIRRAKSQKRQERTMPEWVAEAVSKLLFQRHHEGAKGEDPLFTHYCKGGAHGDFLTGETVRNIYRRYLGRVGLDRSPHSARASFATQLLGLGTSNADVAKALGHAREDMVRVYDKRFRSHAVSAVHKLKLVKTNVEGE